MITQQKTFAFLSRLFGLEGKVAIVTGAGMGIGHSIARYFAYAGAKVVIADRDRAAGCGVRDELDPGDASVASFFETDISDEASVKAMMRHALECFEKVDILVNDAGIFPNRLLADMALTDWERVQSVNLRGTFLCLREAAVQMRKQGNGGRIVNISSIDSLHPSMPGLAHYDASKGGVNMLARSAALEFGRDGITVNAVLPGMIATEGVGAMSKDAVAGVTDLFSKRVVLGRTGCPTTSPAVRCFSRVKGPAISRVRRSSSMEAS